MPKVTPGNDVRRLPKSQSFIEKGFEKGLSVTSSVGAGVNKGLDSLWGGLKGPVQLRSWPKSIHWFVNNYSLLYLLHYLTMVVLLGAFLANWAMENDFMTQKGAASIREMERDNSIRNIWMWAILEVCLLMPTASIQKDSLRRIKRYEPWSGEEVIKAMFGHFPDFYFMVSYCWSDKLESQKSKAVGELPRTLAKWFGETCWVDINKLIPGTQLKQAIVEAVSQAKFRFAFVSKQYVASKNCQIEWKIIDKEPTKCLVFAYPDTPEENLTQMKARGHSVFMLGDMADELSPMWLINEMMVTDGGNCKYLFKDSTPPINEEEWYATVRFIDPCPGNLWLKLTAPTIFMYLGYMAVSFYLYGSILNVMPLSHWSMTLSIVCITIMVFVAPVTGFASMVYFAWFYQKSGGSGRRKLPPACHLLYFLKAIDITKAMHVYISQPDHMDPLYQCLIRDGIVKLEPDPKKAKLKVVDADVDMQPIGFHDIVYSDKSFMELSEEVRKSLGSYIIGGKQESTSVELLAIRMIMATFECESSNALTRGTGKFRQISASGSGATKGVKFLKGLAGNVGDGFLGAFDSAVSKVNDVAIKVGDAANTAVVGAANTAVGATKSSKKSQHPQSKASNDLAVEEMV